MGMAQKHSLQQSIGEMQKKWPERACRPPVVLFWAKPKSHSSQTKTPAVSKPSSAAPAAAAHAAAITLGQEFQILQRLNIISSVCVCLFFQATLNITIVK